MKSKLKVSEKDLQREIIATLKRFPSIYFNMNYLININKNVSLYSLKLIFPLY